MSKKDIYTTDYRSLIFKTPLKKGFAKHTEHFNEHFLTLKQYTTGVYKGHKGSWSNLTIKEQSEALKKRWYVRWSYRNPETKKLERQKNIYAGVNHFTNQRDRISLLKHIEKNLIGLLETGVNPYDVDTTFEIPSTFQAIDTALELKHKHMKEASYIRFKSDINKFKKYLKKKGFEKLFITSIKRKDVMDYLNDVLNSVSARSRNNYRSTISSLWQNMEDNAVIERNFVKSIPMLKSKPKRNKTYTDKQVLELFAFMDKNYPNLLLFVKFLSYNFLRPIEICRLKVSSFDIENKTLSVMVKQGQLKSKTIPEILFKELPSFEGINPDTDLFGKNEILSNWYAKEDRKRAYYTAEFAKVKKHFNINEDYTMYGFRHYHISKLYKYYKKEMGLSVTQTQDKLMLATGHSSLKGLQNYLRSIDAEKSEDYSDGFI